MHNGTFTGHKSFDNDEIGFFLQIHHKFNFKLAKLSFHVKSMCQILPVVPKLRDIIPAL